MRHVALSVAGFLVIGVANHPGTAVGSDSEPVGLYLTWQQDPTTTMTIDWHTTPDDETDATLRYKAVGSDDWRDVQGDEYAFPNSDRTIHRVELTDLEPDTAYRFRAGEFERRYQFRTMPRDLTEPLTFAVGGDTRHRQDLMERTNRAAMAYDPAFIVWGGDLAYADGRADRLDRWYEWFDANMNTLISDEGHVVPIVVGIGNHELKRPRGGSYWYDFDDYEQTDEWREEHAPYFFRLFAFPGQPGYEVLDFGQYMSIVLLDSNHANPVDGEQLEWLEQVLHERQDIPHVFPVYHVPGYPSVRNYVGRTQTDVRNYWTPLFDESAVRVAFEKHDHAYKRTHPIRNQQKDPNGITYIGDGAWGVGTRGVHDVRMAWYLDHAEATRHAIIATVHNTHQHFLVVSEDGDVIDEFPRTPMSAAPIRERAELLATWTNPPDDSDEIALLGKAKSPRVDHVSSTTVGEGAVATHERTGDLSDANIYGGEILLRPDAAETLGQTLDDAVREGYYFQASFTVGDLPSGSRLRLVDLAVSARHNFGPGEGDISGPRLIQLAVRVNDTDFSEADLVGSMVDLRDEEPGWQPVLIEVDERLPADLEPGDTVYIRGYFIDHDHGGETFVWNGATRFGGMRVSGKIVASER